MNKKIILFTNLFIIICILIGCGKKYNITYDAKGGIMPSEYQTEFKVKDNYILPIPTKEGFHFLGWKENDSFVEKLESKNYILTAEWVDNLDYTFIKDSQIFEQEQEEYLVYFMRFGCSWCDKIKEDVIRYQYKNSIEQFNKNIKIYVVNLNDGKNKSKILREYKEEGSDGFYVNEAKKWDEFYIPSTPAMIKIKTTNNGRQAELLERGATAIKNRLHSYLIDENDYSKKARPFEISYELNGGKFNEEVNTKFFSSAFLLPTPIYEGYTFLGWYEANNKITILENKDYHLSAKWEKTIELLKINKEDIFSNDGEYYVLFLKNIHNIKEFTDIINQYNTTAIFYDYPKIYVIDLNDCEEIYRTYSEDKKTFVDDAKDWNEFYISERFTLIKMSGESIKKASFVVSTKNNVLDYLKEKYDFFTK